MEFEAISVMDIGPLAVRARKKLRSEDLLVKAMAGTRLWVGLDRVLLWRGDDVTIEQLLEDFAGCVYLTWLPTQVKA